MKIRSIETFIVKIPRTEPKNDRRIRWITQDYYVLDEPMSVVYSRNVETVFIKVATDEGIAGWGEILAPTSPEIAATIIRTALAPALLGDDPLDNQAIWHRMLNMFRVRGYTGGFLMDAMTGIDIALWDIKGKYLRQPLYALMGGKHRRSIPVYMSSIPGATVQERMESIERTVAEGNGAIKLHTVGSGWRDALEMLRAIRGKYDARALRVMHDGHWRYTLGEARKFGSRMDELDIDFFECPLTPEDMHGHSRLARSVHTPIAVGESMRGLYMFNDWIRAGAVEVIQPDIGRCGITDMTRIAALAEAQGLSVAPHLSVHQYVGFAATVHFSAAIPNLHSFEYQPTALECAAQYSECDFRLERGAIEVGETCGLGVRIDERELARFTTERFVTD